MSEPQVGTDSVAKQPLVVMEGVNKHFGALHVLKDINLTVGKGEVVGLVGESGSGKSITGFSILGLVDEPGRIAGGSVKFRGEELVGADEDVDAAVGSGIQRGFLLLGGLEARQHFDAHRPVGEAVAEVAVMLLGEQGGRH